METPVQNDDQAATPHVEARRKFLASCGKFAALTPPAVTLLLSAGEANYAVAFSGSSASARRGPRGNNGWGNGGGDGSPNGKEDAFR
jgi:hypothetical protein